MRHKKQNGPPHPGQVLDQYLDGLSISEVARALGVSRSTLSRILSCASRVSADVAIRLGLALGTSPDLWAGLQLRYDLYQAGLQKRSGIKRLVGPAKDKSVLELKGMFTVPDGVRVPIEEMRVKLPADSRGWDEMPPVGREIGSPDHDRLEALDARAVMDRLTEK